MKDGEELVRWNVAQHPQTSADVLITLARNESVGIRMVVVSNQNTPNSVCLGIYKDLMQQDALDERLAITIVKRNLLPQTEVLALIAAYGQKVARATTESMVVAKNSLLESVLAEYGCVPQKNPEEPRALVKITYVFDVSLKGWMV